MIDLDEALAFACDIAQECGEIARSKYLADVAFDPKDNNSPVTQADIAINKYVIKSCKAKYPQVGILGEEESSSGNSDYLWVCDPIDGTIPYMLGAQMSTFCLALVHQGKPVVGVVFDFFKDRLFSARSDGKAYLNGKPIVSSHARPLKLVNLEVFPGAPHRVGDLQQRFIANNWQTPNYASSAFMSMAVATDRIAGVVYTGDKAWDIAAAKVIVEACGGTVISLDGKDQRYDDTITGAIVVHPAYDKELKALVMQSRTSQ